MRPASEDEVMRLSMTMAAQAAGAEEPLALVRSEKGGPWTRAKAEALARASQRIAARGQTPGEPFLSLCRLRGERIWKRTRMTARVLLSLARARAAFWC